MRMGAREGGRKGREGDFKKGAEGKKMETKLCKWRGKEGLKGGEGYGKKRRIKSYYVHIQIPCGECDHYV